MAFHAATTTPRETIVNTCVEKISGLETGHDHLGVGRAQIVG